jgi:hypothetical protein
MTGWGPLKKQLPFFMTSFGGSGGGCFACWSHSADELVTVHADGPLELQQKCYRIAEQMGYKFDGEGPHQTSSEAPTEVEKTLAQRQEEWFRLGSDHVGTGPTIRAKPGNSKPVEQPKPKPPQNPYRRKFG